MPTPRCHKTWAERVTRRSAEASDVVDLPEIARKLCLPEKRYARPAERPIDERQRIALREAVQGEVNFVSDARPVHREPSPFSFRDIKRRERRGTMFNFAAFASSEFVGARESGDGPDTATSQPKQPQAFENLTPYAIALANLIRQMHRLSPCPHCQGLGFTLMK